MIRIRWPVALATLFLALLGWYVIYPLSIVDELQQNEELMSEVFSLVQELIQDTGGAETSSSDAEQLRVDQVPPEEDQEEGGHCDRPLDADHGVIAPSTAFSYYPAIGVFGSMTAKPSRS